MAVNTNNTVKKNTKVEMQKTAGSIPESQVRANVKKGSLASKALMVKEYNETHTKK